MTTTESIQTEKEVAQPIVDSPAPVDMKTPHPTQENETMGSAADSEHQTPTRRSSTRLSSKRNATTESPGAKSPVSTPTKKGRKLKLASDDAEPSPVSPSDETNLTESEASMEPTLTKPEAPAVPVSSVDVPAPEQESAAVEPISAQAQEALPAIDQQAPLADPDDPADAAPVNSVDTDSALQTPTQQVPSSQPNSDETKENGDVNVNVVAHTTYATDEKKQSIVEGDLSKAQCDATPDTATTTADTATPAAEC